MAVSITAFSWIGTNAERLALSLGTEDRLHWINTDAGNHNTWYWSGTAWVKMNSGTTKGDIVAHDGTDFERVAVGSNKQILEGDSAQTLGVNWVDNEEHVGLVDFAPEDTDIIALITRSRDAFVLTEVTAVIKAGTNVIWNLAYGNDITAAGTDVFTVDKTTTNKTSGDTFTSFDVNAGAADDHLWFKIISVSAAVDWISITAWYK